MQGPRLLLFARKLTISVFGGKTEPNTSRTPSGPIRSVGPRRLYFRQYGAASCIAHSPTSQYALNSEFIRLLCFGFVLAPLPHFDILGDSDITIPHLQHHQYLIAPFRLEESSPLDGNTGGRTPSSEEPTTIRFPLCPAA